jgi:hypothetical protein
MTLQEFLENIEKMVGEDPSILELEVITSIDDEGNGFNAVYHSPSLGRYDDNEFKSYNPSADEEDTCDREEINSICIN